MLSLEPTWETLYCNYMQGKARLIKQMENYPWELDRRLRDLRKNPAVMPARAFKKSLTKEEWARGTAAKDVELVGESLSKMTTNV